MIFIFGASGLAWCDEPTVLHELPADTKVFVEKIPEFLGDCLRAVQGCFPLLFNFPLHAALPCTRAPSGISKPFPIFPNFFPILQQQKTPARSKEAPCARPKKQSGRSAVSEPCGKTGEGFVGGGWSKFSFLRVCSLALG